jgi:4-amino-4-deoxy-L-arabinose transferase-like glycosyltransferase
LAAASGRVVAGLGVSRGEWTCLGLILALAAAARFVNLPTRGIWDADQGVETGAIWNAVQTQQLPTFGSPAFTFGGTFHHGALFYDLMMPFAWIGNGSPLVIVAAIACFGLLVVPLVWWTARSMGGPAAGLAAALLAAVSPSLIDYSTFIWNPVLVEIGSALAIFGAWQAWASRRPRWWVVAAAGTALASQSHLTGLVMVFPMALLFVMALRRGPAVERRRLWKWGLVGVGLFVLTWLPLIVSELGHNFAETRAILAFKQPGINTADPITRVVFGAIRILGWPMTHWPIDDLMPGLPAALAIAVGVAVGLIWRVTSALSGPGSRPSGKGRRKSRPSGNPAASTAETGSSVEAAVPVLDGVPSESVAMASRERDGLRFVGGTLLLFVLVLSLGLKEISQIQNVNQEQYHLVADVVVILAAGLVVGGLWQARPLRGRAWSGQALAGLALGGMVAVGIGHWPPPVSPAGDWPLAQAAAARIETSAAGGDVGLVNLPFFKQADAYGYPLRLDGVKLVSPDEATTVVVLCDSSGSPSCSGAAEELWRLGAANGSSLRLVDRFEAGPQRTLSVYRLTP